MLSNGKAHHHDRHKDADAIEWNRRTGIALYKELNKYCNNEACCHRTGKRPLGVTINNNLRDFADRYIAPGSRLQILKGRHGGGRQNPTARI